MKNGTKEEAGTHPTPLELEFERIIIPFQDFIDDQTSGSLLLLLCTITALLIANSPLAQNYEQILKLQIGITLGAQSFTMDLRHWVNDGLMSLFFFVLGLEIKREILVGELREPQQSIPVIAAALGGMLAPAAIFFALNANSTSAHGWGIPMATDTAFAIGMLILLGRSIPRALITFLTALAIIDDLAAILVIAIFYTAVIDLCWLGFAGLLLLLLVGCNAIGIRRPIVYLIGGGLVWTAMLGSGVHATVAGVLVAFVVPARPKREPWWFVRRVRNLIDRFETIQRDSEHSVLGDVKRHSVVEQLHDTAEKATTPLRRWEHALQHPVALFVMPIFALANAGVPIDFESLSALWTETLSLGIILGLVGGKVIGISLFTLLALRLNVGRLSQDVTMYHIVGIGLLGGIGFTMAIFIAGLRFAATPETLVIAKSAILTASFIAGLSGYLWLRLGAQRGTFKRRRQST